MTPTTKCPTTSVKAFTKEKIESPRKTPFTRVNPIRKAFTKEKIKNPSKAPFARFNPYSRTTSNPSSSAPSPLLANTGGDLASSTITPMSLEVESPSYSQTISPRLSQASTDIASQSSGRTQDNHLCVICIERDKNILLLPCKHLCLCSKCFHVNNLTECPMCRTKI